MGAAGFNRGLIQTVAETSPFRHPSPWVAPALAATQRSCSSATARGAANRDRDGAVETPHEPGCSVPPHLLGGRRGELRDVAG